MSGFFKGKEQIVGANETTVGVASYPDGTRQAYIALKVGDTFVVQGMLSTEEVTGMIQGLQNALLDCATPTGQKQ